MTPIRIRLHRLRYAGMIAAAAAIMTVTVPASGSEPPFPNKLIKIAAQGQPVADTIRDIFGQAGIQVKVSTAVKGSAAGKWVGTPKEIWTQISRAYNLVAYYDGGAARIYHANEITSRNFQTSSPESVLANARKLGIIGGGNSIKAGQNTVIASGVPEFLNRVAQLAAAAKPAPVKVAAVALPPVDASPVSTQPSTGDIVSPMNKNPKMIPQVSQPILPALQPSIATSGIDSYRLAYNTIQAATAREPYEIRVYFLKYGEAKDRIVNFGDGEEVVEGIASIIGGMMANGGGSGGRLVSSQSGRKTVDVPEPGSYPYGPYGAFPPPQQQIAPEPQQIGNGNGPRVRPYDDGNAVVVRDVPSRMATYDNLIRTFDRPKTQIEVEITIIDVDTEKSRALGIDWSFGFSALGGLFGGTTVAPSNETSSSPNVTAKFVRSSSQFVGAQITALQKNGYLKVVQKPHLTLRENETSVSDSRQTVVVKYSGQYGGGVQDYKIGTLLKIKPRIAKEVDGLVTTMQIDVRDGSIAGFQTDGSPVLNSSQITTTSDVRQGESLIIGGITVDSEYDSKSQVPGLGDIPVAGNLFKKRNKGGSRRERIVIITPRILSNAPGVFNPQQMQAVTLDPKTGKPIKRAPPPK